jgi:hypothetical protein
MVSFAMAAGNTALPIADLILIPHSAFQMHHAIQLP